MSHIDTIHIHTPNTHTYTKTDISCIYKIDGSCLRDVMD